MHKRPYQDHSDFDVVRSFDFVVDELCERQILDTPTCQQILAPIVQALLGRYGLKSIHFSEGVYLEVPR